MKKAMGIFFKNIIITLIILMILIILLYAGCKLVATDEEIIIGINKVKQTIITLVKNKSIQEQNIENFVEIKDNNLTTEIQKAKNHYYLQLDENAKKIYITFENNIDKFRKGEENIELPKSLINVIKEENGQEIVAKAFQEAWDAFSKDKPELFYLDGNKIRLTTRTLTKGVNITYELYIGKGEDKNYFSEGFNTLEDIEKAEVLIEKYEKEVLEIANGNTYNKVLKVHDWIVENVEYDITLEKGNNGNIFGTLVKKEAVCEGYAKLYKYFMDKLEVPCIIISGISLDENGEQIRHAWNYIYINSKWYAVDVTWDDPIINSPNIINEKVKVSDKVKYKYFLKGSTVMNKDHIVTGKVTENGKVFTYPELSEQDFNN